MVQAYKTGKHFAFFIGYGSEHVEVGKAAIPHWIRNFVETIGIQDDVPRGPHSIRLAVTSGALQAPHL